MAAPALPSSPVGVKFAYTTGQVIYAFPKSSSLLNWLTDRVLFVESGAPDLGLYSGTLPVTASEWYFFVGAAQPASWDLEIGNVDTSVHDDTATADALLKRDLTLVTGAPSRSPLTSLAILRNRVVRPSATGTMTVYDTDDTTPLWTSAVTITQNVGLVTESDPA